MCGPVNSASGPDPTPAMPDGLRAAAVAARGFMPTEEGDALWVAALEAG